jgi:hypothetical protein
MCDVGCEDIYFMMRNLGSELTIFQKIIIYPWALLILDEIERQERVKQKCKDGSLSIFDLL